MASFFELIAKFGADTTGFRVGAKQVESIAQKTGDSIYSSLKGKLAAAFGAAAITAWSHKVQEATERIYHLSKQFDHSYADIQKFDKAFAKSGLTAEDAVAAFFKLSQVRREALGGDKEKLELFSSLGISEEELRRSSDVVELAKRAGKIIGEFERGDQDVLLKALFGKGGGPLRAAIEDLNKAIPGQLKYSDETIDALHELKKTSSEVYKQISLSIVDATTKLAMFLGLVDKASKNKPKGISVGGVSFGGDGQTFGLLGDPKQATERALPDPRKVQLEKLHAEILEKELALEEAAMTTAEKKIFLQDRVNKLKEDELKLKEAGKLIDAAETTKKRLDIEKQLIQLPQEKLQSLTTKPDITSLQRIGGEFRGPASTTIAERSLSELQKISRNTGKIAESNNQVPY